MYTIKSQFYHHSLCPLKISRPCAGHYESFVNVALSLLKTCARCQRGVCKQDCVLKATHPIRVSFLVFVFSNFIHISSFCFQRVTKQFTSSRHQSKGHAVSCLDRFLFHLKSISENILLLSADKSVLVKTSPYVKSVCTKRSRVEN